MITLTVPLGVWQCLGEHSFLLTCPGVGNVFWNAFLSDVLRSEQLVVWPSSAMDAGIKHGPDSRMQRSWARAAMPLATGEARLFSPPALSTLRYTTVRGWEQGVCNLWSDPTPRVATLWHRRVNLTRVTPPVAELRPLKHSLSSPQSSLIVSLFFFSLLSSRHQTAPFSTVTARFSQHSEIKMSRFSVRIDLKWVVTGVRGGWGWEVACW